MTCTKLSSNESIFLSPLQSYPKKDVPQQDDQRNRPDMSIHEHPPASPNLQRALKATLPYSISLVCRTKHANRTPYARVLATFSAEEACVVPECWVAAYFDHSMRPETDLWIFAASEVPGHAGGDSTSPGGGGFCPVCKQMVLSLLGYMSRLDLPPIRSEYMTIWDTAPSDEHSDTTPDVKTLPNVGVTPRENTPPRRGTYFDHLRLPGVVTLGAAHHQVVEICAEAGLVRDEFPGREAPLNKFFFKIADLPNRTELPPGLRWGDVRKEDLPIVKSFTEIPRNDGTLLSLQSLGIFVEETDKPVSWTFLGLDGSLTTLTTDPNYRGKGLAKALATKIMRDHAADLTVDEEGNAWAHADVYEGNTQSERVCRSLGGYAGARVFWVRIDLSRAHAL